MGSIMALLRPIAYLALPYFALRWVSSRSRTAKYYLKVLLYVSGLGVFSVWGVFVSIWAAIVGRRYEINYLIARSFLKCMGPLLGISYEIEGAEHLETRASVIVGNHQSMLDVLYLGVVFPRRSIIMGKKELFWAPLLGQFMWLAGSIFIDRSDNKRAVQSLKEAGNELKRKSTTLMMFPEGTRTSQEVPGLRPFKKGAFHLAVDAQIPIVPVVCENYWRLYHKGVFEGDRLRIRVLPPISTVGLTGAHVDELAKKTHRDMLQALKEISVRVDDGTVPAASSASSASSAIGVTEVEEEGGKRGSVEGVRAQEREVLPEPGPRQRTISVASEETSDEGAVLVRRP